jgi:flagellar hook protein FlgE
MGLTGAMLTGFTGIKSNQFMMDTIGDNVANVNTTAFKNQRALFETMYYQTLSGGTAPSDTSGGVNPMQIGYGSTLSTIQRNFGQGTIQDTGVKSDLALDGEGFFILDAPDGDRVFTRDGSFRLDERNTLVTGNGSRLLGYAADSNGDIIEGTLTELIIPLGTVREAVATTSVVMDGNLDADSDLAGSAGVVTSDPLVTAGGTPATATTALTALVDENDAPLFATGDVITIRGAQKGEIDMPEAQFVVGTDGSTLGDFAAFLETAFGINTDPATGGNPGVTVSAGPDPAAGSLVITSNLGMPNAITLDATDVRNSTTGALPFTFSNTPATGDGATTSMIVYDSLGNQVEMRIRVVMESQSDNGTVWRFYAESNDDNVGGSALGTGTITFDQNGQFVSATGTDVRLDQSNSGAATPMQIAIDFSALTGLARGTAEPQLVMTLQDGYPAGTLVDYSIDQDGIIAGTFSNAQTRVFGQVAVSVFANPEGLIAMSNNTFAPSPNSGEPAVTTANSLGAGSIESGSLELSNVELSREFIGLVTAATGFSAASRVVRSADDMLQELLLLVR